MDPLGLIVLTIVTDFSVFASPTDICINEVCISGWLYQPRAARASPDCGSHIGFFFGGEGVQLHASGAASGEYNTWKWGDKAHCSKGSFANAFEIKVDGTSTRDLNGMEAVKLWCSNGQEITSHEGDEGNLRGKKTCTNGYLNSFRLRDDNDDSDKLGATDLYMRCNDNNQTLKGGGSEKGKFREWTACPKDWAITGLQTRIDTGSGAGDQRGLLDVKFWCKAVCITVCMNGGNCTAPNNCTCPDGYTGDYCETPVCSPECMNGGSCTAPNNCTCSDSYTGMHCETYKYVIHLVSGLVAAILLIVVIVVIAVVYYLWRSRNKEKEQSTVQLETIPHSNPVSIQNRRDSENSLYEPYTNETNANNETVATTDRGSKHDSENSLYEPYPNETKATKDSENNLYSNL
ncbi:unnamed protein product, partial [Meganyctiphanes norvegica]